MLSLVVELKTQEMLRNLNFNICKVAMVITMEKVFFLEVWQMQNRSSGVHNGIGLAGDPAPEKTTFQRVVFQFSK